MSLPDTYFAELYTSDEDPWGFRTRWYEKRKRDVTLAALTRPRFRRGFEPGCSIGVLTKELAARCDRLLATDIDPRATAAAQRALSQLPHVVIERRAVPREWPPGDFDLVVLSEIGYYLSPTELDELFTLAADALEPGGSLVCCHWRHLVRDYPLAGDEVHARARAQTGLVSMVHHEEEDFLLDVFSSGAAASPARREGLLG